MRARRLIVGGSVLILSSALVVTLPVPGAAAETGLNGLRPPPATPQPGPQDSPLRYLGPDGSLLPFSGNAAVEEFLLTAEVIESEHLDIGINGIDRLVLEKDGVRARAGFRNVDVVKRNLRLEGEHFFVYRDSYIGEVAAYTLAKWLGMDAVPPAVLRPIGGVDGSVQLWVEGLRSESAATFRPESGAYAWIKQTWTMIFFDSLLYNIDRNSGNFMVDESSKLWLIDHTRAFQEKAKPFRVERVNKVNQRVWERLLALDEETVGEMFQGLLESGQVSLFLRRRAGLIEYVEALVEKASEAAVFF